jgi:hypothetical protein
MNANRVTVRDRSVLTDNQRQYRDFVIRNPGCSIADVCRTVVRPGDYVYAGDVYASIRALVVRNVLRKGMPRPGSAGRGAVGLYAVVP